MNTLANLSVIYIASELHSPFELKLRMSLNQPKVMCLIVLCSTGISDEGKKELEQTIVSLKKMENWEISRVTLMEDQRDKH